MIPVAVLLAGAGSSAGFVGRAFGAPLAAAGYELVAVPPEPGPDLVPAALAALDAAAVTYGPRLRLVGGVSLGAHLAVRWAAGRAVVPGGLGGGSGAGGVGAVGGGSGGSGDGGLGGVGEVGSVALEGVLVALPAWTGAPGVVAAATAGAADTVERLGTAGALAAAGDAVPWVAAELAAAWPAYGDRLASSLRAAAASAGPSPAELTSVRVPAGVVAFADDPLHPYAVATGWAAALPRAALRTLHLADLAADRAALGTAALAALTAARQLSTRPGDPRP